MRFINSQYIFSIIVSFALINGLSGQENDEQINILVDNDFYFAGEPIRYAIDYSSSEPGKKHGGITVFTELLDSTNLRIVTDCRKTRSDGTCEGSMLIPETSSSGYYILRSYTYRMMKRGLHTFGYKIIPILNPVKGIPVVKMKERYVGLRVDFTVESGQMVSGVVNKLTLRCKNFAGQPVACRALAIENDRITDTILFDNNGAASMTLIPHQDSVRKLILQINDSLQKEIIFPRPQPTGTSLFVSRILQDTVHAYIGQNPAGNSLGRMLLILSKNDKEIRTIVCQMSGRDTIICLNTSDLQSGEYVLKLTDNRNKVRNITSFGLDRLSEPTILIPDRIFGKGDSIPFEVQFPEAKYAPERIVAKAILTEENLFSESGSSVRLAAFITRQIKTEGSLSQQGILFPSDGKGLVLSGLAKYRSTGLPAGNLPVRIAITNGRKDIYQVCTDSTGYFHLILNGISGKVFLVYQPLAKESNKAIDILPFPQFSEAYILLDVPKLIFSENDLPSLEKLAQIAFIERNFVKKEERKTENKTHWVFYGKADEVVDMNKFIELPQMEEVFRELCRYILLTGSGRNLRISVLDKYTNRIIGNNPLILVDGIPMDNHQKVLSIKPSNVKTISTVAGKYYYQNSVFDGVIDIEFRKKDAGLFSEYTVQEFEGYSDSQTIDHANNAPLTRRLYWQPFLKGENGVFRGIFMAKDIPGTYCLSVEGIDRAGNPFSKKVFFKVQ